jgi:hypothetical protein
MEVRLHSGAAGMFIALFLMVQSNGEEDRHMAKGMDRKKETKKPKKKKP